MSVASRVIHMPSGDSQPTYDAIGRRTPAASKLPGGMLRLHGHAPGDLSADSLSTPATPAHTDEAMGEAHEHADMILHRLERLAGVAAKVSGVQFMLPEDDELAEASPAMRNSPFAHVDTQSFDRLFVSETVSDQGESSEPGTGLEDEADMGSQPPLVGPTKSTMVIEMVEALATRMAGEVGLDEGFARGLAQEQLKGMDKNTLRRTRSAPFAQVAKLADIDSDSDEDGKTSSSCFDDESARAEPVPPHERVPRDRGSYASRLEQNRLQRSRSGRGSTLRSDTLRQQAEQPQRQRRQRGDANGGPEATSGGVSPRGAVPPEHLEEVLWLRQELQRQAQNAQQERAQLEALTSRLEAQENELAALRGSLAWGTGSASAASIPASPSMLSTPAATPQGSFADRGLPGERSPQLAAPRAIRHGSLTVPLAQERRRSGGASAAALLSPEQVSDAKLPAWLAPRGNGAAYHVGSSTTTSLGLESSNTSAGTTSSSRERLPPPGTHEDAGLAPGSDASLSRALESAKQALKCQLGSADAGLPLDVDSAQLVKLLDRLAVLRDALQGLRERGNISPVDTLRETLEQEYRALVQAMLQAVGGLSEGSSSPISPSTVGTTTRSGSLALSLAHERTRDDVHRSDSPLSAKLTTDNAAVPSVRKCEVFLPSAARNELLEVAEEDQVTEAEGHDEVDGFTSSHDGDCFTSDAPQSRSTERELAAESGEALGQTVQTVSSCGAAVGGSSTPRAPDMVHRAHGALTRDCTSPATGSASVGVLPTPRAAAGASEATSGSWVASKASLLERSVASAASAPASPRLLPMWRPPPACVYPPVPHLAMRATMPAATSSRSSPRIAMTIVHPPVAVASLMRSRSPSPLPGASASPGVPEAAAALAASPSSELPRWMLPQSNQACSSCGNMFVEDAIFCRKCGRRRPPQAPTSSPHSSVSNPPQRPASPTSPRVFVNLQPTWKAMQPAQPAPAAAASLAVPSIPAATSAGAAQVLSYTPRSIPSPPLPPPSPLMAWPVVPPCLAPSNVGVASSRLASPTGSTLAFPKSPPPAVERRFAAGAQNTRHSWGSGTVEAPPATAAKP
eukprot:TRINITY_DN18698_c0_g1_i1.p1 TRINITY_DN18698_c0_g1~~TRINITY_DN18698_c0_g1_i1.p1  ORF type:complete len:1082 (-),score=219.92 TRINITY_DN18698_c0_g1_i1:121-3366(-)